MAARKHLRAVPAGGGGSSSRGSAKPLETALEAAEHGSRLDELRMMRRIIAKHLDNPKTLARDIASLSRRQMELSRDIEALETVEAERVAAQGGDDPDGESSDEGAWSAEAL